jgi:hypothetical protein
MSDLFKIINTKLDDLPFIYELFEHSIAYQEAKGYPVWRNYDKGAIVRDIEEKNQYKVVNRDGIGIVFSVGYRDRVIWRALDQGESMYLHRIVVNPAFKGQKLFGLIMDTWAVNTNIINYYTGFGFEVVETYTTPDTPELPVHNRKLPLTLMEYRNPSKI